VKRIPILLGLLLILPYVSAYTFCIERPTQPFTYIRYLLPDRNIYVSFNCNGPICCGDLSTDTNTRVLLTVEGNAHPTILPLYVMFYRDGVLARSVLREKRYYAVTYTNNGEKAIEVEENYPKSMARDASAFSGKLLFLNPDPTVLIYVPPGVDRSITYRVYTKEAPLLVPYIELATCSPHLTSFSYKQEGKSVLITFKIQEHGRPVYVSNMMVKIDDRIITPQYDAQSGIYSVYTELAPGKHTFYLTAEAAGCPSIVYQAPIRVSTSTPWLFLAAVAFLIGIFVVIMRSRRR